VENTGKKASANTLFFDLPGFRAAAKSQKVVDKIMIVSGTFSKLPEEKRKVGDEITKTFAEFPKTVDVFPISFDKI